MLTLLYPNKTVGCTLPIRGNDVCFRVIQNRKLIFIFAIQLLTDMVFCIGNKSETDKKMLLKY